MRPALKLSVLASVLLTSVNAQAHIDVFPGAGTPLQDAITSAAAGDSLYVHAGTYPESVVVDRALHFRTIDGAVIIDAGCATDTAVDITADDVGFSASATVFPGTFRFVGGAVRTVRMDGRTDVQLKYVSMHGCPAGTALEVANSTKIRLRLVSAFDALVGIEIKASSFVKLVRSNVHALQTAIRFVDIADVPPRVTLKNVAAFIDYGTGIPPERGVHFINSDGIRINKSSFGAAGPAVELDANSDNNRLAASHLETTGAAYAIDAGTGNLILNSTCSGSAAPCP